MSTRPGLESRSMAVPSFQSFMRPVLAVLEDGRDYRLGAIRENVLEHFALSEADREELLLPSGRGTKVRSRVGWAATYLYHARLLERPRRGVYRITDRGREVAPQHPDRVNLRVLNQFPEFVEFHKGKGGEDGDGNGDGGGDDSLTPQERIDAAYREIRKALAAELRERIAEQSPAFFEQLVLDVLHAMGYGGTGDDTLQRLGQSGHERIDGIIREDRLGLHLIYLQAKRWSNPVGSPEIRKFIGALVGKRATKGVFITTSSFTREARDYADEVAPRIILVNGEELAQLMIEHGVGVAVSLRYEITRIDLDYFATEEPGAPTLPEPEPSVSPPH